MQTVVLASSNAGKLQEMNELLSGRNFDIRPQADFNVEDADETGLTFVENSILKARHAATLTSLPALADDSGIEVDALDGAPGIYSARFAAMHGKEKGDENNNRLLLEKLEGVPPEKRTARFRTVIVFMRHKDDPSPLIAHGVWNGSILSEPSGEHGFGYDPLFLAPETGCSAAMLEKKVKNTLSHRGKALASLIEQFDALSRDPLSGYGVG